ncbi:MAG TPA: ABC transporter permease [Anaerolineales bacterium]|jgi:peptide/nickel transport system permease protein|nr:glutathione ABC transporter permease GsiC [Anaerolineae bacterium]HRJ58792.1 ABC transporter permease [Anaerolineales bacterium]HRK87607.1 ABC transporter permease [Anaerolineales bacterium]
MFNYLVRRLFTSILVLFGISVLVFSVIHLVPGDVTMAILGRQKVSEEKVAELRAQLGLNDPLYVQYGRYISNALQGDLGKSIRTNQSVSEAIAEQLPSTFALAISALSVALAIGGILGLFAALRHGTWFDTLVMGISVSGLSIPTFWMGLLLILFFSVRLKLFPSISNGSSFADLFLPALTLGLPEAAVVARMVRASMLDVLNKEYITTARAKGMPERLVILKHALRNALIPVVTFVGLQMAYLLGGATIVETMFARQGIGRLAVQSIYSRDYPMVQGVVLITAAIYVLINTLTDITYVLLNPKIRLK